MAGISLRLPPPITELRDCRLERRGVRLLLKREDLIHPDLPGNKWRKLKYNISAAKEQEATTLLTFGGAYSNHIRATAAAGRYFGFRTIGVIRGEQHLPLNDSLAYAVAQGMTLSYLDRSTYRDKDSPSVLARLRARFGEFYLLPEGGSNAAAARGCRELVGELGRGGVDFDVLCCPCGTGGTLAGVAAGLGAGQRAIGFSVLKGGAFLFDQVAGLQRAAFGAVTDNWVIETGFPCGGFARRTTALDEFIRSFELAHAMELEWVYVAKMMYGIFALVERGIFAAGTTVVALVTG